MSTIKVDTVSNTGGTKSVSVVDLVKVDSGIIKDLDGNALFSVNSYTPSLTVENGTDPTVDTATGYYIRVNSLVFVIVSIEYSAKGTNGLWRVSLPFTPNGRIFLLGNVSSPTENNKIPLKFTQYSGNLLLMQKTDESFYFTNSSNFANSGTVGFSGVFKI